jgi:hypothetical protein
MVSVLNLKAIKVWLENPKNFILQFLTASVFLKWFHHRLGQPILMLKKHTLNNIEHFGQTLSDKENPHKF